jgi:hypothetical protein
MVSLLTGVAEVADDPPKDVQYTLASYPKWKEIDKLRHKIIDIQVTTEGKRHEGNLNTLPSLDYPFGKLSFKHDEVAVIFKLAKDPTKVVYITIDGERYVATPDPKGFEFVNDFDIYTNFSKVRLIITSAREEKRPLLPLRHLYTVKMNNGDTFSALLTDPSFSFGQWKKEVVPVDDIISLSRDKGVRYTHGDKQEHLIPFVMKDKTFNVFIPKLDETLPMQWSEVESIEKVSPDNDSATIAEILALLPKELQARVLPGLWRESNEWESHAGVEVLVKNEPSVLFDPDLGFNIPEDIVFEPAVIYPTLKMMPETILSLSEELVYQSIAMVDIEPEAFDVPPVDIEEEEEPTESFNFVAGNKDKDGDIVAIMQSTNDVRLSAEQIAELQKILESEDQEVADGDESDSRPTESRPIDRDNTGDEQFEPVPN